MHYSYLPLEYWTASSVDWTPMIREEALGIDQSSFPDKKADAGIITFSICVSLVAVMVGLLAFGSVQVSAGAAKMSQILVAPNAIL
jgi:hypothetical protein